MGSPGEETNSIEQEIQRKQTRVGGMTFTRYTVQMQQSFDRWERTGERELHALSLAHLAFALSSALLFFVAFLLFEGDLVFTFCEPGTVWRVSDEYRVDTGMARGNVRTNLRISSFITASASASISSSSLNTSRAMYELRSLPNNFQISELNAFSGSRRFDGGGEGESEGDRGRFLGGIPPDRGGAPPATDTDLVKCDLGTGLLDCEDLKEEDESFGIVDEDVLVLSAGLDCEDDLDPHELDNIFPLAARGCDLASSCDAVSASPRQLGNMTRETCGEKNALTWSR